MNFDQAFDILTNAQHEGGYVNDPKDPGGETKYGLSKRTYPGEDIKNMTLDRAKAIYARDYWGPAGCDGLPDCIKYQMFDIAVNTSAPGHPSTAIKLLQRAVGADVDGAMGPNTLMRAQSLPPMSLHSRFCSQIIRYYTGLSPEARANYLTGWMNRLATNMGAI